MDDNHPLLYHSFFDTPLNLTGYVLAKELSPRWIRHFEKGSFAQNGNDAGKAVKRSKARVAAQCMLQSHPLHRTSVTQYLEWKYDDL